MDRTPFTAEEHRAYARNFAASVVGNWIDNHWAGTTSTDTIEVVDPSTGDRLGTVPASNPSDIDAAVRAATDAQPGWGATAPGARSKALLEIADLLDRHFEELVALEVVDVGKPITAVREDELPGVIDSVRYFAGAARALSAPAGLDYLDGVSSTMRREPVGVVAAITPWNYPILQAVAKIVPALATGNTVVIKPAETTPYSTARMVELAGQVLPAGVLNLVLGTGPVAGEALSRHPEVDLVSFTGSVEAGRKVGAAAADGIKKTVLELGGNAPVLVFADADLDRALDAIVLGGLYNGGQECMAATRLIVHDSIRDEILGGLRKRIADVAVGDPLDPDTTMGPLNSSAHLDRVVKCLSNLPPTATVVGGERLERPGFYLNPAIVTGVAQHDEIVREEVFGPVFTLQTFTTEAEALELANGTPYGLAASLFTNAVGTATRVQNALEFGTIWVNNHLIFGPDMPVSGFGVSGIGAENSELGVLEFTRLKHVMVDHR